MAKKLINKNQLQDGYCRERKVFYIDKEMILSQSAMDFAREHQIKLEYDKKEETSLHDDVKKMLKYEYGIENENVLEAILNKLNQK